MIKFTKVYKKWYAENNGKYDSAIKYHKALMKNFEGWQPPKELVEVPKIVAYFTEEERDEILNWINEHQEEYMRPLLDGYTVEKEKMYILKHIDLSEQDDCVSFYLAHSRYAKLKHVSFLKDNDMSKIKQCHFTQSEIDKLNIGSYEKIEVEP